MNFQDTIFKYAARVTLTSIISLAVISSSYAQNTIPESAKETEVESTKLPSMAEEIANLTRSPLGEGSQVFNFWMKFTVSEKGATRSGILYFSDDHPAFIWTEDLSRPKSQFYKSNSEAKIITIVPEINKGTQFSDAMLVALGYIGGDSTPVIYVKADPSQEADILGITCYNSTVIHENTTHTLWIADKSDFKKVDRSLLDRAVKFWLKNQPKKPEYSNASIDDKGIILGVESTTNGESEADFSFKVLEWGDDSDLTIDLSQVMVAIPGLNLNQVAKEYVKDLEKQKSSEERTD